ncbi:extracellular solute-binding protein, partial [Turicibacter sanguinis]|nr:extracellular solute-binding protein [Turicibacter sanguinis]
MKDMKKALSFLALTGLSLSLAGCGGQTAGSETNTSTNSEAPSTQQESTTSEKITLTIGTHHVCGDNPKSPKVGTEGCMSIEEAEYKSAIVDQIEEEYGITFEFYEYQSEDKIEEITGWNLAGTSEADIVRLNADEYTSLVKSGNLADITNYVDKVSKEVDVFGNDLPYRLGVVGSSNYGVARDNMIYPELLVFDVNILEDAGMEEMPNELWQKGEWTFDTAREYFKKVQQYADSSSELTYAFGTDSFYIFKAALAANGVKLIENGESNVNSEAVYETMSYLETLRNDGVLNIYAVPYAADDTKFKYALTDMKNLFGAAQSAWEKGTPDQEVAEKDKGGVAFTLLDAWRSDCCIRNSDKEYGVVPFPENSSDAFVPAGRGDMYAIPISVSEDKLEIITKAMALFTSVHTKPTAVQEWSERNFPTQDDAVEIVQYLQDKGEIDPYTDYSGGYDWSYTSFVNEWFVDPTTLTTHLETLDGIIKSN